MIDNIHDNFFKKVFSDLKNVRDFLSIALPENIKEELDFEQLKIDPTSHVSEDIKGYFSDVVVQTRLKGSNTPTDIYLLMEHKSYHDKNILIQLLHYMYLMWQKDANEKKDLRVIIPLVFYHGKKKWNVPKAFVDQFKVPNSLKPYLLNFTYLLFDTSQADFEEDANLKNNIFLLTALVLMKSLHHKDLEAIKWVFNFWKEKDFIRENDLLFFYTYIVRTREEDEIQQFALDVSEERALQLRTA